MPHTIIALDPRSGQRGLLVEVHPEIREEPPQKERRGFERRLFEARIRTGLFVTPSFTWVVRDRLSAMDFASNEFEWTPLSTPDLLASASLRQPCVPEELHERIREWLIVIPERWMSTLPKEAVVAMVPDVLGHLLQADFESFDGVLERIAASA